MIKLIGTNHDDLKHHDVSLGEVLADRYPLDDYDHIFTEGFSQEGVDHLDEFIAEDDGFRMDGIPEGGLSRGLEPESLEKATESEIIYLDDDLSDEVLNEIAIAQFVDDNGDRVTPYRDLKTKLKARMADEKDYREFFGELRDGTNYVPHDYAAINESDFDRLLDNTALRFEEEFGEPEVSEDFREGLEEHDITFEDYVEIYADGKFPFQYARDEEWHSQITDQIEEGEKVLVVAGINHMLDAEGTFRSLLEQDYKDKVHVIPYNKPHRQYLHKNS